MSELVQGLQDMQRIARLRKTMLARENLLDFIEFTSPDPEAWNDVERSTYKAAAHHRAICQDVQDFLLGKYPDHEILILTVPPRHGKSEVVSRRLPAWLAGKFPTQNIVVGTYNDDFAADFGDDVRRIIQSKRFKEVFPTFALAKGGTAKDRLKTTKAGQLSFVGRGGSLTGRGAHVLVLDDIIKDDKEAASKAIRDSAWNWFARVAMTRRMGDKRVIMTFCLTGDTPVSMADGSAKRLDQIEAGDKVVAWAGGRQAARMVTRATCSGEDEILEVRTRSSLVRGNARHPFLVNRGGALEWVPLGDLVVGDLVVTAGAWNRGRRAAGISDEEAWALGFFLGDGWVTVNNRLNKDRAGVKKYATRSFVSCVADCPAYPDRVERAMAVCREKFGAAFKKTRFRYWRAENAALGRWLLDFGMGAGAKGKRVPAAVFRAPASVRRAYLDGFAAADGCLIDRTGDQGHHNAKGGYCVTQILLGNRELVADLRHLARGLGYRVTNITEARSVHRPPHSAEEREWVNWQFRYHHRTLNAAAFTEAPVTAITPVGREKVYDLTVDGDENFIADGLVVHNTRWHSDDPIGRLTDPENEFYSERLATRTKIINLPAIAEQDDPLGRAPGEALWPDGPDRFDEDFLAGQQALDPIGFSSLYQQRPTVEDGILFRRENVHLYEPGDLPEDLRYYCASDHAVTTEQRSDYSCLVKVGVDRDDHIWLVDAWWQKARTDVVVEAMLTMGSGKTAPLIWWAEKGHISKSIGPFLKKRMVETGRMFNLVEVTPIGDKEQRAQSISARMALGRVHLPAGRWWTDKAVNELLAFPNGRHDDFVDAMAYIGLGLRSQVRASPVAEKKKAEPRFGTYGWIRRQQRIDEESLIGKGF